MKFLEKPKGRGVAHSQDTKNQTQIISPRLDSAFEFFHANDGICVFLVNWLVQRVGRLANWHSLRLHCCIWFDNTFALCFVKKKSASTQWKDPQIHQKECDFFRNVQSPPASSQFHVFLRPRHVAACSLPRNQFWGSNCISEPVNSSGCSGKGPVVSLRMPWPSTSGASSPSLNETS